MKLDLINSTMQLDMELEAEIDAQAFGSDLRAIKVRLQDGTTFALSATVPWCEPATEGMERVRPLLCSGEACYILFRTATWALISYIPDGAPAADRALYASSCATLHALLGGRQRVPNLRSWTSPSHVQLDDEIAQAPALCLGSSAAVAAAVRAGETEPQLPPPAPDKWTPEMARHAQ